MPTKSSRTLVGVEPSDAPVIIPDKRRTYVLSLLLVAYILNFVDRNILSIVAQPMKEELALADWQVGLLGGLAFAFFYVIMGLPVARIAERSNRVGIVSVLLVAWSIMTAVCGLTQNFFQLLLARVGVGVGEAGCSPASHSLIADYFPPEKRATALSIYSLGIPLGPLIAGLVGGWAAQKYGWRAAFMVVALPGLLLAVVTWLTLEEPVRGRYDSRGQAGSGPPPPFMVVLRRLMSKPAFLHVAFGAALATFANYGISNFAVPYLLRGFTINIAQAGTAFGLISGVSATIGTGLGGWLVDKFGVSDRRNYVFIPAIGVMASAPLYVAVLLQTNLQAMALLAIVPATIHYLYLGPTFGLTANMVETRMRATASAIVLLIMNLIGLGFGPLVVGILSDTFASQVFTGDSFLTSCPGGRPASGATGAIAAACRTASFTGLKYALLIAVLFYVWAGVHFLLASRTLVEDTRFSNEAP